MRLPARYVLTGAAVLAVTSCSVDGPVVPAAPPSIAGSPVLRALAVAQSVDLVIPAEGGTINILGAYTLNVPAGAVCDPNAADTQEGYAAQAWDSDCTPANRDIAIRATLKWSNGTLYADFQPALRFVPSKTVTLGTSLLAPTVQYYNSLGITQGWSIGYTHGIEQAAELDALQDPSLRTIVVGSTGKVFRRIKHFSGYLTTLGNGTYVPCDPAAGDPLCIWYDEDPS